MKDAISFQTSIDLIYLFLTKYQERMSRINLLTVSGGGIRGVIPIRILVEMELYMKKTKKLNHINELFDLCVATSIGSVIVAALLLKDKDGNPKYTASQMLDLFLRHAQPIFYDGWKYKIYNLFGLLGPKYSAIYWKKFLRDTFGETLFKDLLKPMIIPVINTETQELLYIDSRNEKYKNMKISDILIGATSAPYYFPAHEFTFNDVKYCFIDGGISLNNPGIMSYLKAKKYWDETNESEFKCTHISIGTGYATLPALTAPNWGLVKWTYCLIDYMMHTTNMSHEYHINLIMENDHYYKINPQLPTELNYFDNAAILYDYLNFMEKWIDDRRDTIHDFALKLINNKKHIHNEIEIKLDISQDNSIDIKFDDI